MSKTTAELAARICSVVPDVFVDLDCFVRATARREMLRARDLTRLRGEKSPSTWEDVEEALADGNEFSVPLFGSESATAPRSCPPLEKDVLRNSSEKIINERKLANTLWVKTTSGTTGSPIEIPFDEIHYLDYLLLTPRRVAYRAGTIDDPERSFFSIYISDNTKSVHELWLDPFGGGVLQWVTPAETKEDFVAAVELIRSLRPDALSLRPSLLEFFVKYSDRSNLFSDFCHLAIVSGADLPDKLRIAIERSFGIPIINAYGLTEFGIVASECENGAGLHFDPDVLVELLNDENKPVEDGSIGQLVLTSTRNRAMPLVRYKTGDLATIDGKKCKCGRMTPRLLGIRGRTIQNFKLPSGRLVSPTRFNQLFDLGKIKDFQLIQAGFCQFHLEVEVEGEMKPDEADLRSFIAKKIGEPAEITIGFGLKKAPGVKFERYRVEEF